MGSGAAVLDPLLGGFKTTQKNSFLKKKIDLCSLYALTYFSLLALLYNIRSAVIFMIHV